MTAVSGKTKNGFTYDGDYEPASKGRIQWNATFRRNGDYAGMRHGCLFDMQDVPAAGIDEAVKADIESTWTDAV